MSTILAQSIPCCNTGPGPDFFKCGVPATPLCVLVPPGATITIDSLPTIYYKGAKWLVNVATVPTFTKVSSYEVYSINRNGVASSHTTYSILGQLIPHRVFTTIAGANMELRVTNNDVVTVKVCVTRLPIPTAAGVLFIQSLPVTSYVPIVGFVGDIDPTSSLTIDTVRYPRVKSVKWLIAITQPSTNEKRTFEVYCTFRNGTFVAHTTYGFIGDLINVNINAVQSGSSVSLVITNNELSSVEFEVTRIPIALDLSSVICEQAPDGDVLIVTPINNIIIPSTVNVVVDAVPTDVYSSVKWLVSLTETTTNKVMGVQVYATHRGGTFPVNTNYAIVGDFILSNINVNIVGADMELQITNNSLNTVVVDLIRLPVSV